MIIHYLKSQVQFNDLSLISIAYVFGKSLRASVHSLNDSFLKQSVWCVENTVLWYELDCILVMIFGDAVGSLCS